MWMPRMTTFMVGLQNAGWAIKNCPVPNKIDGTTLKEQIFLNSHDPVNDYIQGAVYIFVIYKLTKPLMEYYVSLKVKFPINTQYIQDKMLST